MYPYSNACTHTHSYADAYIINVYFYLNQSELLFCNTQMQISGVLVDSLMTICANHTLEKGYERKLTGGVLINNQLLY